MFRSYRRNCSNVYTQDVVRHSNVVITLDPTFKHIYRIDLINVTMMVVAKRLLETMILSDTRELTKQKYMDVPVVNVLVKKAVF